MKKLIISGVIATAALISVPAFAADVAAGQAKTATCVACHGPDGISIAPNYPNLKGQKEAYLAKAIKDFRDGVRKDPTMNAMAAPLTDDDIANIAAYYSSLK